MSDPPENETPVPPRPPHRKRTLIAVAALLAFGALVVGLWISVHYTLPNAKDPAVMRDVAQAERVIAAAAVASGRPGAVCRGWLLRRNNASLFTHANCAAPDAADWSGVYEVRDDAVVTGLGADASDDQIRDLLGWRLGNWYLNHRKSFVGTPTLP